MKRFAWLGWVFVIVCSCAPRVVTPAAEATKGLTPELAEGKVLFRENCAKCHRLKDPNKYTADEWRPILMRMQKKARISDEEREKIYHYVTMK